jgi:hypothetical protein
MLKHRLMHGPTANREAATAQRQKSLLWLHELTYGTAKFVANRKVSYKHTQANGNAMAFSASSIGYA